MGDGQEFLLYLLGLVAVAMQDVFLFMEYKKESTVSKHFLHIPKYTGQPAPDSHRNI